MENRLHNVVKSHGHCSVNLRANIYKHPEWRGGWKTISMHTKDHSQLEYLLDTLQKTRFKAVERFNPFKAFVDWRYGVGVFIDPKCEASSRWESFSYIHCKKDKVIDVLAQVNQQIHQAIKEVEQAMGESTLETDKLPSMSKIHPGKLNFEESYKRFGEPNNIPEALDFILDKVEALEETLKEKSDGQNQGR